MELFVDAQALHETGMSVVKDKVGIPQYILTGRHGFTNDGIYLHTIDGTSIGDIRQKTLGLFPRYDLTVDGQRIGSIKKMLGVWREFIFVSDLNWIIVGNLLANQYHIYHGVKAITTIATVGSPSQTVFQLSIDKDDDVPAALLIAAILDRWRQVHLSNPLVRHDVGISYGV